MRALIASGGTGGHFYPGFALACELKNRGWEILFLVKKDDICQKTLDDAGFPSAQIDLAGLPRSVNPARHFSFIRKLFSSMSVAGDVVRDWKPDAVMGAGGYISFPAVLAARRRGIPALLHESNAKEGLSNKAASFFADVFAMGLPISHPPKCRITELTGTPIRDSFAKEITQSEAKKAFGLSDSAVTILVFGGSQGAARINTAVQKTAQDLESRKDIQFLHITGRRDYDKILAQYGKVPGNVRLLPYCDDMNTAYRACDVVICRSGASTVAELVALKKPAVLIPLPTAAADHQTANALVLSRGHAAILLKEDAELQAGLADIISDRITPPALEKMRGAYQDINVPNPFRAARRLADLMEKAVSHK